MPALQSYLGFLGGLGVPELLVILLLVLVLFGAKKIPDLARGLGKGITEFKKGLKEPAEDPAQDALDNNEPKKLDDKAGNDAS